MVLINFFLSTSCGIIVSTPREVKRNRNQLRIEKYISEDSQEMSQSRSSRETKRRIDEEQIRLAETQRKKNCNRRIALEWSAGILVKPYCFPKLFPILSILLKSKNFL